MMQTKSLRIFLALVLMVTLANAGRGHQFRNHRNSHRPRTYNALINLKAKLNACKEKFVCDVMTTGGMCEPICIDRDSVCNGMQDCTNQADEMNCPTPPTTTTTPTTPTTPTTTPAIPTTTPCPECEISCDNDTFACDGVCHPIAKWCDGSPECVDGSDEACVVCCADGKLPCGGVCATICDGTLDCPASTLINDEPSPNCDCVLSLMTVVCLPTANFPPAAEIIGCPAPMDVTQPECLSMCQSLVACTAYLYTTSSCSLISSATPLPNAVQCPSGPTGTDSGVYVCA